MKALELEAMEAAAAHRRALDAADQQRDAVLESTTVAQHTAVRVVQQVTRLISSIVRTRMVMATTEWRCCFPFFQLSGVLFCCRPMRRPSRWQHFNTWPSKGRTQPCGVLCCGCSAGVMPRRLCKKQRLPGR